MPPYGQCQFCGLHHDLEAVCAEKQRAVDDLGAQAEADARDARRDQRRAESMARLDAALGHPLPPERRPYGPCTACHGTGKGPWTTGGDRVNCSRCVGTGVEPSA